MTKMSLPGTGEHTTERLDQGHLPSFNVAPTGRESNPGYLHRRRELYQRAIQTAYEFAISENLSELATILKFFGSGN